MMEVEEMKVMERMEVEVMIVTVVTEVEEVVVGVVLSSTKLVTSSSVNVQFVYLLSVHSLSVA